MSRATRKRSDPRPEIVPLPTNERISKGDIEVSGRGSETRARVVNVVERLDRDCQHAASWILAKSEAAQFSGYKLARFERYGHGSNVELLPSERGEAARIALRKMWARIPPELAAAVEYRLIFDESEEAVAIRLGLSRGQVSRRFRGGLRAIGVILRGRRS